MNDEEERAILAGVSIESLAVWGRSKAEENFASGRLSRLPVVAEESYSAERLPFQLRSLRLLRLDRSSNIAISRSRSWSGWDF
jgi:hypothetical protein